MFVNTAALTNMKCGPSNKLFWPSVAENIKKEAIDIAALPKSPGYRENLAPYLHRRVQLISTKGWNIVEQTSERTRLCLNDAMLIFVGAKKRQTQDSVRIPTGHMHIHVSNTWMRFVNPQPNEDLLVNGILYEYKNAHGHRNIAILPVIVTPIKNHHKNYKKRKKKATT